MKKKIKILEQRVAEAKAEVARLEAKLQAAREKDQHKKIDKKLDGIIEDGTHKWDDVKRLGRRVSSEIKLIVKG
jgi:hypothetical protein